MMLQAHYPRKGYSFCACEGKSCDCAYEVEGGAIERPPPAWGWSLTDKTSSADVKEEGQTVYFHPGYSNGNACVRGDTAFVRGFHYFWEIKVTKPVYGSSVMIGVGTSNVPVNKFEWEFCHMLGDDADSWGLTFRGMLHHNKASTYYHPNAGFSIGSIIGVHLDMWNGTLEFFINREPLGVAFRGLRDLVLYPMITSTAAHSSMQLTYTLVKPHSLSFLALRHVGSSHFKTLPYGLGKQLSESWWHFPKPTLKDGSKNLVAWEPPCGIYLLIDSDEEEEEVEGDLLRKRMKRVLENSIGPLPPKRVRNQPATQS